MARSMTQTSRVTSSVSSAGAIVQGALDQLESRFAALQEQIDRLQRLASLGTMSAVLVHEINNVLTPIKGYCVAASRSDDASLKNTAIERTLKGCDQLSALCERIMAMASNRPAEAARCAVAPIIREAIACLGRDLAKDNIELRFEVTDGVEAWCDAASLQQVFFNLILNARQAMAGRRGTLVISSRRNGNRVEIDVRDSGPGIAAEHLPRIFEPFYSTKGGEARGGSTNGERGGVGLGLHTCKRLVESMDGALRVASEPGKGATFTIGLDAGQRS